MLKDRGDVMWWEVREVHLLFLCFKGMAELLYARLGPTHTIHTLTEMIIRSLFILDDQCICTSVRINNTWTERARLSISDVQWITTKGTSSGLSRGSRERSTPNTDPFLCSHSSWHTSIHFLCKARPHWMWDRKEPISLIILWKPVFCPRYSIFIKCVIIPLHIQPHWQQYSCHTACIWPFCFSFSWVDVIVQLAKPVALWLTDHHCTLQEDGEDRFICQPGIK